MRPGQNSFLSYSHSLPGDKREVADLWQDVFQDSKEFTELFFSRVFKPEHTLVVKRDKRIISALQMVPCEIKIADRILPSAYVCGVCTLPSERGKGIMNRLMTEAMNVMRQKEYALSILIPAERWLFDFYKKFGYTHPVNYKTETYSLATLPTNAQETPVGSDDDSVIRRTTFPDYTFAECVTDEYFPFFDRKQRERRCTVLHNAYDFETILRDLKYEQGSTWVALKANKPVGIAFAKPESEHAICIKEILYDDTRVKKRLIDHILNQYHARTATVRVPVHPAERPPLSDNEKIHPFGLACILTRPDEDISGLHMALMLD
jgi:predicted acetyltransferase